MSAISNRAPLILRLWLLLNVICACAGWGLSALHALKAQFWSLVLILAGATLVFVWRRELTLRGCRWGKYRRRFRRPFAAGFAVLAMLALLGGLLYAPSNPDGLTQRIPRLLNWLAEGRWHWIENAPASFNTRATGFEWLMAPLIAISGTDRLVFLLNASAYLLLPGLVYSVFHRLGVCKRTAWHWMWLAPTGYCFLLQAGSIGNDMAGAVLALAAVDFALRCSRNGSASDGWYAILGAALMTNAKSSNLPLLLPWGLALLPGLKTLLRRPLTTLGVCILATAASLVPVTWFNLQKLGDWSGATVEAPLFNQLTPPVAFVGNALNLVAQNFAPPVFPLAKWWNDTFYTLFPPALISRMEQAFEPSGAHIQLMELQLEVAAGLGFGLSVLLVVTWLLQRLPLAQRNESAQLQVRAGDEVGSSPWLTLVRWSVWVALLVYMIKTGLSTSARIIAPYYLLLIPALLTGAVISMLTRRPWWRFAAIAVLCMAGVVLVINPARPLWPARSVLSWLNRQNPGSATISRAVMLYDTYSQRWDALAPVRRLLPPGATHVGLVNFASASSIETSLWRPFGARRVYWFTPESPLEEIKAKDVRYIVVSSDGPRAARAGHIFEEWFPKWLQANDAAVVGQAKVRLLATGDPIPWYVVAMGRSDRPENTSTHDN